MHISKMKIMGGKEWSGRKENTQSSSLRKQKKFIDCPSPAVRENDPLNKWAISVQSTGFYYVVIL